MTALLKEREKSMKTTTKALCFGLTLFSCPRRSADLSARAIIDAESSAAATAAGNILPMLKQNPIQLAVLQSVPGCQPV